MALRSSPAGDASGDRRPRPLLAGNRIGKRFLFCWVERATCPSDLTNVFAFDDDYAMGVLTSSAHVEWARQHSSTLRVDLRYTPTTAFETFPWPQPAPVQRTAIADVAVRLISSRQEICRERRIGLTALYNQLDEGAWTELRDLHVELDGLVGAAYGWEPGVARSPVDSNARLSELNGRIARGEVGYDPFGVR